MKDTLGEREEEKESKECANQKDPFTPSPGSTADRRDVFFKVRYRFVSMFATFV